MAAETVKTGNIADLTLERVRRLAISIDRLRASVDIETDIDRIKVRLDIVE